jgi:hypothetical protein
MEWPLMSECVGREEAILIMNQKMPNKHFFPETRSYTFDDEKNDWLEESYHNFYFFEGEDAKVIYYYLDEESEKIPYPFE